MKIQLQSLRVVNCGPLDNVCIQFNTKGDSPVTVLAGANGSGKTTVLKAIVALAKTLAPSSSATSENGHGILEHADFAQMTCLVEDEPLDVFYGTLQEDKIHSNYYGTSIAVRYGSGGLTRGRRTLQTNGSLVTRIQSAIQDQQSQTLKFSAEEAFRTQITEANGDTEFAPSFLYFPYERGLTPVQGKQMEKADTKYEWVYQNQLTRSFKDSLDSYLIWLDYTEQETYKQAIDFLDSLDFDGKKFGVRRKELRAIVTTNDEHTHGISELSSGEQNILIILLELRRRLIPGSIVLIDEIENSLHLAFQHRLGQGLKRLQEQIPFQLIVTTHSSEFVDIFGPSSVRILTEF